MERYILVYKVYKKGVLKFFMYKVIESTSNLMKYNKYNMISKINL